MLLSLGAAFGLSVLVWQHIFGLDLNWIAPVFGLIILLAVGSDYNLLLVSRFQEEIGAGLKTGIIRSMGEHRRGRHRGGPGIRLHHDVHGQPAT